MLSYVLFPLGGRTSSRSGFLDDPWMTIDAPHNTINIMARSLLGVYLFTMAAILVLTVVAWFLNTL
jgi:hypothetical protein